MSFSILIRVGLALVVIKIRHHCTLGFDRTKAKLTIRKTSETCIRYMSIFEGSSRSDHSRERILLLISSTQSEMGDVAVHDRTLLA